MAVEAVVSVVIQKVTDFLIQESIIFDKVVDQVEDIRLELRQMRGFLIDAEDRQKNDAEAKKWVQQYLETIYIVEDMVEFYVLRLVRKKTKMCVFQNYGFHFHDLQACKKLRWKMKQIEKTIKNLNDQKPKEIEDASLKSISFGREREQLNIIDQFSEFPSDKSFNSSNLDQTKQMRSFSYKEEGSDFVGFKDKEKELVERLTRESDEITGVIGPIGSGKTTLVKRIYNRKSVAKNFDCHAWLDVSEEQIFKNLLLRVWSQVSDNGDKELTVPDEKQLKEKLSNFLQGKKYLIVLDDARKQPDAWSELIKALPKGNGSKVVLITSDEKINEKIESGDKYFVKLRPLDDEESWELLLKKSYHEKDGSCSPGLDSLKNHILEICQGLPQNIMLLGGFLSTKRMSYEECNRLLSQDILNSMNTEVWLLCYADLPVHYKLCLLYLTLFPKEFDLSVRRIIRLWLAEGFLQRPPGLGLGEDLAEECFNDLVQRNLVKVSKLRSDGGPRKCHLPGFLRERLSPIAQDISLFHIHQTSAEQTQQSPLSIPSDTSEQKSLLRVRRIVEYVDIQDYVERKNIQNLRSYLSFNFQRYDTPAKGVGTTLSKIIGTKGFGLLRVLDLEGVYKPSLPKTLKHLFQLRYLGLRWTFLDSLPKCVGDLPYLETLDLKRTYINTLPSSVWKLKCLRHLYLPQVRLDTSMQEPASRLLTLWGLIIDDNCDMKNGLNKLCDLRELGITCQLNKFDELMSWIASLTHIQSLNLTSKNEMGCPSNLRLGSLSKLVKLSRIELLGKLSPRLEKNQFPESLRVLTLSVSHLDDDPMEILSQLPCLSVLRLLAKSYVGKKMNCPKGFPNLRVLKLWMLNELEEWKVQEGAMPSIKELNIRFCQKLTEVPLELMQNSKLEKLVVTSMPTDFEKYVRHNISEHTLLKINTYEFTPLPWDNDPDLWK